MSYPGFDAAPAHLDDLDDIVAVLTSAFADDPVMGWVFPDPATRPQRLSTLWAYLARGVYLPGGASTIIRDGDRVVAAALWLPPDAEPEETLFEREGDAFIADLDGEVERLGLLSEAMAPHHPADRAWYLLATGVLPELQGRGIGAALLSATLTHLDRLGEAAYLEASSARSRVLYHRLGFGDHAEFTLDDGPPVWGMWRPSA
jgi:GNAT superfamily N-acetyltransferase